MFLDRRIETSLLLIHLLFRLQIVFSVLYSHGLVWRVHPLSSTFKKPTMVLIICYLQTHLRSLGLSKSQTAITFISGPLSGILLQPLFGIWSDHCHLSWGQRRPFIALGGAFLISLLLALAWTKSIVELLSPTPAFNRASSQTANSDANATVTAAIVFMFGIYSAVQPIQGGIRALVFDVCPAHQQKDASAWITIISGIASILGYLSAAVDLSKFCSWFGDTQFKNLSVLASLSLAISLLLTCTYIREDPQPKKHSEKFEEEYSLKIAWENLVKGVDKVRGDIFRVPMQIKRIYLIQLFAWIGWYPYLVYATT